MSDGTHIEWTDATVNAINGCTVLSPGCTNCYAMRLAGTRLRDHPSRKGLTSDSKVGPVWNGTVRLNEIALLQPLRWKRPRRIFCNAHGDIFHPAVPDAWIDRCFAIMALTPHHIHQVLTKRAVRMRTYLSSPETPVRIARVQLELYRSQNMTKRDPLGAGRIKTITANYPLPNVWLGVSVEDQKRALERIPDLLATPAAVRWLSCEPLLGPIYLTDVVDGGSTVLDPECWGDCDCSRLFGPNPGCRRLGGDGTLTRKIDWVVVGGESGPGARPMHPAWARDLRDQCAAADVPFFFKQWGDWAPVCAMSDMDTDHLYHKPRHVDASRRCKVDQLVMQASGRIFPLDKWSRCSGENPAIGDFAFLAGTGAMTHMRIGKRAAGRLLDGVQHDGMPI